MNLYAVSDIHVNHRANRDRILALEGHGVDWLLLGGDVAHDLEDFRWAVETLRQRFARVIWVPGNHELWTLPQDADGGYGQERYDRLVSVCRELGVDTPEDPYPVWDGPGGTHVLAGIFLLYDYSFSPDSVGEDEAVAWAAEAGIRCNDENYLSSHPYPSKPAWCRRRVEETRQRLEALGPDRPIILLNHFPLREEWVTLPRFPRFSIWCGTRATETWHLELPLCTIVTGHLHIPRSGRIDGVRFEEVSLGYPRQWRKGNPDRPLLRRILPDPDGVEHRCRDSGTSSRDRTP